MPTFEMSLHVEQDPVMVPTMLTGRRFASAKEEVGSLDGGLSGLRDPGWVSVEWRVVCCACRFVACRCLLGHACAHSSSSRRSLERRDQPLATMWEAEPRPRALGPGPGADSLMMQANH